MTPMTVRGLPRGLQRDAWWMAPDAQTGVGSGGQLAKTHYPIVLLVVLIACVDLLMLRSAQGLGQVVLVGILAGAAHWVLRESVDRVRALKAWACLAIALIPAIDLVQFTSWIIAWGGLVLFAVRMTGDRIGVAIMRLPLFGAIRTWHDIGSMRLNGPDRSNVNDWILPLGVGGIFVALFVAANPILTNWLDALNFENAPSLGRVMIWIIAGLLMWPLLRLRTLNLHKNTVRSRAAVGRVGVVNVRSVGRALVVFNLLFAMQTMMDLGYLWGGVRLPDGMTYANYAHRGAYPLMMTALLAGGFALIAQPWLDGRRMRGLLLVWIAQTLVLVMSSILRLDLYVDIYGLTHMRFAAFVWMAVVALGLVVLIMQVVGRHDAGWMLRRAFGIGVFAVYMCSLMNVTAYVARQQMAQGSVNNYSPIDNYYVCNLGPWAAVEILENGTMGCNNYTRKLMPDTPNDWREWGFRNARLRNTLAEMNVETGQ